MSDTPRTDAQWYKATPTYGSPEIVPAKFARELELDLTAAQARIAKLEAALEAAKEMAYCERGPHLAIEDCQQCAAIKQFRAAMEGK